MSSESEEGVSNLLDTCIKCVALARIVHGDEHWILAKMHVQLANVYLQHRGMQNILHYSQHRYAIFSDLPQQALKHAVKASSILTSPGSPLMSHDAGFEVRCQLVLAHSIAGQVYTAQGE